MSSNTSVTRPQLRHTGPNACGKRAGECLCYEGPPSRSTLVLSQSYPLLTDEHTITVVAHHYAPVRTGMVTLPMVTLDCCLCGEPVDTDHPDTYTVHRVRGDSKYGYEPMHAHICELCDKCGDTEKGLAAHMSVEHPTGGTSGPRIFSRPDYVPGKAWR